RVSYTVAVPLDSPRHRARAGGSVVGAAQLGSRFSAKARGPSTWSGWPHMETSSLAPALQASVSPRSSAPHSARLVAAMAAGELRAIFSARAFASSRGRAGG